MVSNRAYKVLFGYSPPYLFGSLMYGSNADLATDKWPHTQYLYGYRPLYIFWEFSIVGANEYAQ